jgi:hypothetical protein
MNRKFFIAWIVLFVAWMAGSVVVHGVLLGPDYRQLPAMFRDEADGQRYLPVMLFAHLLVSGAFVWIYRKGLEARDWFAQGLRYGVTIALLTIVPTYLIYYAVQPMPGAVVAKQMIFDSIGTILMALAVAFVYRSASAASE